MQKMTMTTALLSLMYGTFLHGIIMVIVNMIVASATGVYIHW